MTTRPHPVVVEPDPSRAGTPRGFGAARGRPVPSAGAAVAAHVILTTL
ncbi:hypothetical protein [Streptomyces sp. NPDC046862]